MSPIIKALKKLLSRKATKHAAVVAASSAHHLAKDDSPAPTAAKVAPSILQEMTAFFRNYAPDQMTAPLNSAYVRFAKLFSDKSRGEIIFCASILVAVAVFVVIVPACDAFFRRAEETSPREANEGEKLAAATTGSSSTESMDAIEESEEETEIQEQVKEAPEEEEPELPSGRETTVPSIGFQLPRGQSEDNETSSLSIQEELEAIQQLLDNVPSLDVPSSDSNEEVQEEIQIKKEVQVEKEVQEENQSRIATTEQGDDDGTQVSIAEFSPITLEAVEEDDSISTLNLQEEAPEMDTPTSSPPPSPQRSIIKRKLSFKSLKSLGGSQTRRRVSFKKTFRRISSSGSVGSLNSMSRGSSE